MNKKTIFLYFIATIAILAITLLMMVIVRNKLITASNESVLPCYSSFKINEINIRSGPGTNYPIILHIDNALRMPILLEKFSQDWYLVSDETGRLGWVNQLMLSQGSIRMRAVVIAKTASLTKDQEEASRVMAILDRGVIVQVKKCEDDFCELFLEDQKSKKKIKGWGRREDFWGLPL